MRIESRVINPEQVIYFDIKSIVKTLLTLGIKIGSRKSFIALAFGYHSHQCDQRWWGIRLGKLYLAYRTKGDASKDTMTYKDSGMWWPWHVERTCSGFYL